MNPKAEEQLVINHLMIFHIPKVSVYRFGTLKPTASDVVEVLLKFSNPNMTRALLKFKQFTPLEALEFDPNELITTDVTFPEFEIKIDPGA